MVDDSGSMVFEENGERVDDLKTIVARVVNAAMLFDDDGISIRFMKWPRKDEDASGFQLDNIKSEVDLNRIIENVRFTGTTPLASALQERILRRMVLDKVAHNTLEKPVLILAITDGRPSDEKLGERALQDVVKSTAASLSRSKYGIGAVSYQIAQVGNDDAASKWLEALDNDPEIGHLIDVTSSECPLTASVRRADSVPYQHLKKSHNRWQMLTSPLYSLRSSG